jgi:hypothetical protein
MGDTHDYIYALPYVVAVGNANQHHTYVYALPYVPTVGNGNSHTYLYANPVQAFRVGALPL